MIDTTQIAKGIYRIALWDEADLLDARLILPGATMNLFLIAADRPTIVQTMLRHTFERFRAAVARFVDPRTLQFIVVPHHEGDSSGAINEWLAVAPKAVALCSELCAGLSLRDFAEREVRVVADGEVVDLGSHRLRVLITPQVNQWDSLMVYEEVTGTLFPNDLFSSMGYEVTSSGDRSAIALGVARELGYQPNDRAALGRALDKIAALPARVVVPMHGPAITGHIAELIEAFRANSLAS
jgi:flavorubredoxin